MRLINADWLLDVVENIIDWDTERDKNRIIHQVRELTPTVDTEPRRWKWNRLDMDTFNCNKCGATFVLNQGGEKMHFCPNCGAKMR